MRLFTCLGLAVFAAISASGRAASGQNDPALALPKEVTFNAHIRPIFSDTCFACHGFDAKKREADLRLDTPEGAYAKLKDSEERAIVPGKPDESAILKHILSDDPDEVMPPKKFHKDLTDRQKLLIRAWVEQGAKYEQHWAFSPVEKPPLPELVKHANKGVNPIDSFILAKLEADKIEASPIADKATLLRRLSLDLTGLPPSPEELDRFLADQSPDAYPNQVERLLASPHYGERMAVPWLDVVRFADTVGFHGDQNMRIFPYRDYVIKSFNDNKRFDQFTTEQIAGDLLPDATDEQRVATGFLRLNPMTREGGAQAPEYLAKYMGDRVRSIGAAWLGLTTGCCECHDHKFDPIKAKDFYSLGAFFADVREWGVYSTYSNTPVPDLPKSNNEWPFPPEILVKNTALLQRIAMLRADAVGALVPAGHAQNDPALSAWLQSSSAFLSSNPNGWQALMPAEIKSAKGTPFEISADQSVVFHGAPIKQDVLTLNLPLPDQAIRAIQLEVLPDEKNARKVGRQPNGKFMVKPTFAVIANGKSHPIAIARSQADRRTPKEYDNGEESPLLEPEWMSAPAIWEEPLNAASLPHHALYHLAETLPAQSGRVLQITLASEDIGRVRFSITPFADAIPGETNAMGELAMNSIKKAAGERSEEDWREIAAAGIAATLPDAKLPDAYRKIRDAIIDCRGGYAKSLIAQAVPPDKVPKTHLLPRGNWMTPAEEVLPAVPEFLPHASVRNDGTRLTRLDLAHWLTAKENPLPARQFTNRLWKQFFGKGLSNVLDDLGNQGEWPSHPELLDWLAAEFRDSGWDVKHMVRLIVTSRTYQQVSASRADLVEIDPANRLLAEQSARRLDAEFIRDNALAISGLLNDDIIGGPSVKPYQPEGYFANLNFPERGYDASTGSDQYRRGVYMFWQRTFMHPMLGAFDAPSRESCTADRLQSNSPQQALTLLNDPSFVEAARALALRVAHEKSATDDAAKINYAIRLTLSREAKPSELTSLTKFIKTQRDFYQTKPDDAKAFLKIGLSDHGVGQDPAELAAWSQLCRVILNLHESITIY